MRILILEDEPIIAIDLEDIVTTSAQNVECCLASTAAAGLLCIGEGVDFAMIDINLAGDREGCWTVVAALRAKAVPFCFVTSSRRDIPQRFRNVPFVAKPFAPRDIARVVAAI
ncbi:MAG: response regulator [Rhizobiaceae bacterium]|nr:response regulator [Rhizobiaceae bacterium]